MSKYLSGTPANRSGSITAGGTQQTLAVQNDNRMGLFIQNISDADMWINEFGSSAAADTAGSYKLVAGDSINVNTSLKVSIIGATTGKKFTATEV